MDLTLTDQQVADIRAGISESGSVSLTLTAAQVALVAPVSDPIFGGSKCVDLGLVPTTPGLTAPSSSIFPYSAWTYSAKADAVIFFGGGHAASPDDGVNRMPISTLVWGRDYDMLPLAKMQQVTTDANGVALTNPDGSPRLTYMSYPAKFWQRSVAGAPAPAISPVARHTYTQLLSSSVTGTVFLLDVCVGSPYIVPTGNGGNAAEYDPATRTWTDLGFTGLTFYDACAEDPVTGYFILMHSGSGGPWCSIFDPRQRKVIKTLAGSQSLLGTAQNLTYYPPNDSFYYFTNYDTNAPNQICPVFEFKFDRNTLTVVWTGGTGKPVYMTTNYRPKTGTSGQGFGLVYDSANQLIVGNLVAGMIYGFRPTGNNSGTWYQQPVAAITGQPASFTHCYVPRINAHIIGAYYQGTGAPHTYALRWDPALETPVVDPRLPRPTIAGPAGSFTSMQSAYSAGGAITVTGTPSGSALYGGLAAGTISVPVQMTAVAKVLLAGPGINDQGIVIVQAAATIDGFEIAGAVGVSQNDASIRHLSGDLTVRNSQIHDSQDGILSLNGVQDWPYVVSIDNCDVYNNGVGDGQSHGLYIGRASRLTVANSRFWHQKIGHHIKSRAVISSVSGCTLGTDFVGTESYNVDLPFGGAATIDNCYMRKGPSADNVVFVNFGTEGYAYMHPNSSLTVSNITFDSQNPDAIAVRVSPVYAPNVVARFVNCDFRGAFRANSGLYTGNYYTMTSCKRNGVPFADVSILPK
jgi:hypothetical protein